MIAAQQEYARAATHSVVLNLRPDGSDSSVNGVNDGLSIHEVHRHLAISSLNPDD